MKFSTLSVLSSLTAISALPSSNANTSSKKSIHWKDCDRAILKQLNTTYSPITVPVQCGSLKVPLDYTGGCAKKLDLALLRVKATEKPFRGSVLINPGGPGSSGVEYVAQGSEEIHQIIGEGFDLIGFDPRGTGKTIPFDCGSDEDEDESEDDSESSDKKARRSVDPLLPETNLTDYLFTTGWEESKIYAKKCFDTMSETGSYISTAFVVRDMVQIIDALGEDGMLRYWGTSYGTQLGATFAAMFPERVDRVLLDGNLNPHDYVAGTSFDTVKDADSVLLAFMTECVHAPEYCAAAEELGEGTTVSQLLNAFGERLAQLRDYPGGKGIDLYDEYIDGLYNALYGPEGWSDFADQMVRLMDKKTSIKTLIQEYEESDNDHEEEDGGPYNEGEDALLGITCIDNNWRAHSPEEIVEVVKQQGALSTFSGSYFPQTWYCPAWKMKAREAYTGNFTTDTKNPILFVNSRWDPVTPLFSAFNSSAGFKDSVVLTHNGYGHGFTAHPSACTAKKVRSYFVNGVLPKPGTQCDVDSPPFEVGLDPEDEEDEEDGEDSDDSGDSDGSKGSKKRGVSVPSDDMKLRKAMLKLHRVAKRHVRL